ncbi:MAG: DNA translocase FtsK [Candidatus Pelagibacter sp. TMED272]|nr:DNA translocase FtsK [Pelagibacteraceae bacterium]RPG93551.1 MAG: DNA translocase FtsK [Candidatus Pelagibacter sp. TMED272]|tara:strand:- start:1529 stop:3610 length:2082 start_codon:yes stop_codon:yes gene_type:complete
MNTNFLDSLTNFLKKRTFELLGLVLILSSVALAIAFTTYSPEDPSFIYGDRNFEIQNFFGIYGSSIADFLLQSFGLVSFLLLLNFLFWGLDLIIKKEIRRIILKLFLVVAYLTVGTVFIYLTFDNSFWLIDNGNSGFVGKITYNFINTWVPWIDNTYSIYGLLLLTILFFSFSTDISYKKVFSVIVSLFRKKTKENIELDSSKINVENRLQTLEKPQQSFSFDTNVEPQTEQSVARTRYKLPDINYLNKNLTKLSSDGNKNRPDADFIEKILLDFGIDGKIKAINNGPVVSLYEFEPAPGVKVSKIINLSEDLARNTSSTSTRVSVIPGKNTVGIEIPNEDRESVSLREIISFDKFQKKDVRLPIALGKSISGMPIVGDLTSMPHLLIAGTTGSGKSVCINTIIVSLLYKLSPDLCKFILIDPKMLELSTYEGIPHLLTPVITDAKKATSALSWTVKEMNSRYKLMSKVGVRNIDGYNAKHKLKMPYIVVVVDEMSDLMLVAGKEIENYIQKLSQMARAAGIHIIMATQRPSVDVITGTIKANFPTRISFQVSSKIDSRTILGEQGAEQLLGKGDMLFMSSANRIVRIHGPYVSEQEIEKITSSLRAQGEPDYMEEITSQETTESSLTTGNDGDEDELFNQAVEIIKAEGKASTSFLQRKLQIGYNRAARIIDMMEEKSIVSKANHVGKREVL